MMLLDLHWLGNHHAVLLRWWTLAYRVNTMRRRRIRTILIECRRQLASAVTT